MKCKKCGGHMTIDFSAVLTSIPPKYKAECDNCGNVEYTNCYECSEMTKEEMSQVLGHEPLTFEQMKELQQIQLQHDWKEVRNKAAIAAMQAIISDYIGMKSSVDLLKANGDEKAEGLEKFVASRSVSFADALIAELRKDSQ